MVWIAVLLAACDVRRYRDDAPPPVPPPPAPTDRDTDPGEATADTAAPCPDEALATAPAAVSGDTSARSDDHAGSCGDAGGDVVVAFTAPAEGRYTVTAPGHALYALDDCFGAELACDPGGRLEVPLAVGETVFLVVDGDGPFTLEVSGAVPPCADFGLDEGAPASGEGDTTAAPDDAAASCGGDGVPDHLWSWTAPASGTFVFDTIGSSYDTVLYVLDGCGGVELGCDDDITFGTLQSEVAVTLSAGETVIVGVDGYRSTSVGPYALNVRVGP